MMETGSAVKRLSEFLPPDARARILRLVLDHCDIAGLAKSIGCTSSTVREWWNGRKPSSEDMAKVLAVAFLRCEETKDVIDGFLNEAKRMCEKLNFSKKLRKMDLLMSEVDEKSRRIVQCFLRDRHAGIRKLSELIDASSDMEVLTRIRGVINPKAEKVFGKPIIKFERSKIDPLTGEKVVFSWWLWEDLIEDMGDEGPLDIFDEKNGLRVVALLPPQEGNVEVEVRDDFLIISGKEYHREVPLFYPVEKMVKKTINNGILEVELNKIG